MVIEELKEGIIIAIDNLNNLSNRYEKYNKRNKIYIDTFVILNLFTFELNTKNNVSEISDDLLRALHDLSMSAYKEFENTNVETAIEDLIEKVYYNIPRYNEFSALNDDFDKFILENIKKINI